MASALPTETHSVATEDLRNVVNLASEIEDVAPEEAESLNRLRSAINEREFVDRYSEPEGYDRGY